MALAALALWVWVLTLALGAWRWNSVLRLGPPERALFPYGELRVAIDPSNPPFAFPDGDGYAGIEPELARALGERLGVPVRFVPHGFDGLYDALKTDQADVALAALVPNPARTADVSYSRPYFNAGQVLVVNGAVAPDTLEAGFAGRVALAYGTPEQTEAERWLRRVPPFEVRPYETHAVALDALRLGDADAALVDAVSAGRYRAAHPDWESAVVPVTTTPYAAALRPDRPGLAGAFDRALQSLMLDGSLNSLLARYLP
jgi:polar amino acid transport system substrate-binding protein